MGFTKVQKRATIWKTLTDTKAEGLQVVNKSFKILNNFYSTASFLFLKVDIIELSVLYCYNFLNKYLSLIIKLIIYRLTLFLIQFALLK